MSRQPHHAVPSPNMLPPNPFAAEQPSAQRATASIDLTSATSPSATSTRSAIFERDLLPAPTPPRLHQVPGNAERRKLSDATRVPNPATGYQGPSAMKKKPAAGQGFIPINTLESSTVADRINPAFARKHSTTYGKHDRRLGSIGKQRHSGQQAYLEQRSHRSQPSPAKRRKFESAEVESAEVKPAEVEPVQTVEIEDSEEEEVQQQPPNSLRATTPRPHSILSSRSPRSTASKQSGVGLKLASLPKSEFENTSDLLKPKRTIPRRKNAIVRNETEKNFAVNVPSLGAGSLSEGQSLEMISGDVALPGQRVLGDVETTNGHQFQHPAKRITSQHFPSRGMMRISESTAETADERPAEGYLERNLREFRPATGHQPHIKSGSVEVSEDELAPPNTSKVKCRQVPVKETRQGKATRRQKHAVDKRYELSYVRTHNSKPDSSGLVMRPTDNKMVFRISNTNTNGEEQILHMLNLTSVNKAVVDDKHCMRLTGGRSRGNQYWYDLEFHHTDQFIQFRDDAVFPELIASNFLIKSQDHLRSLFRKPLPTNATIDEHSPKSEALQSTPSHERQQLQSQKSLLSPILTRPLKTSSPAASNRNDLREPTTRSRVRPLRNTRATNSTLNGVLSDDEKEVVKYSKTGKLGKPWPNHLDFNVQEDFLKRRRCTVNFDDLPKLDEEEFLNDSLVNFYLLYLYTNLGVSVDRVYFFNTYFFDTLTKNTSRGQAINYDAVKSWTKRDDVFSYEHIVVPINEKFHWYLAIICNITEIGRQSEVEEVAKAAQDSNETVVRYSALGTVAGPDDDASTEPRNETNELLPAQDLFVGKVDEDDEENLFEEEKKLNLIDPDEEDVVVTQQQTEVPARLDEQTEQEAFATAALQSPQAKDKASNPVPHKAKQSQKKKKSAGPKRDPKKPVIMVLDSLGSPHSNATRALREWLEAEAMSKRGLSIHIDNKGFYPKSAQIPMQDNFSDCGLYVLGYAKKFFADPEGFKERLLKGEMSSEADWPDMDASKMRSDIRELILQLYEKQKGAHKAKRAAKAISAVPSPTVDEDNGASAGQPQQATGTHISASASPAAGDQVRLERATTRSITPAIGSSRLDSTVDAGSGTAKQQACAVQDLPNDVASASPPTVESPQESTMGARPARPEASPMKRVKSPESRVATKSPHVDVSSSTRPDSATNRSYHSERRITDLSSPMRKHELQSSRDEKLHTESARKARITSPSRTTLKGAAPSDRLRSRTRSGSHDDPIPLDDSQDLDAPMQRQTRTSKVPSPEIIDLDHSQEYTATPIRRGLPAKRNANHPQIDRDDSIQEGLGRDWREGRDFSRALKASIQDQQARRSDHKNSSDLLMEDSPDVPGNLSQSSHTLEAISETQLMDVDDSDTEVPESPQQRRESPGAVDDDMDWQSTPI